METLAVSLDYLNVYAKRVIGLCDGSFVLEITLLLVVSARDSERVSTYDEERADRLLPLLQT